MQKKRKSRHLYLMRNAQTKHSKGILNDFSKTLTEHGLQQIFIVSQQINRRRFPPPDCVLCSSATRTVQTLELLLPLFPNADIFYKDSLYLAPKDRLEEQINLVPNTYHNLLIIAHHNGLENLLNCLIDNPKQKYKMPLSACAFLTLKPEIYWRNLCQGTARLDQILIP